MPLQKLQFRPGINREGTTLANEGGWYAGDKIRFRSGQVEKIGGWVLDGGTVNTGDQYIGVIRSLWNWIGLNGYNYLGLGTNQKFYIQQGTSGYSYDVTPIRSVTTAGEATFAKVSSTLTLNLSATATELYIVSNTNFSTSGIVLIGSEQISYTGKLGTTTLTGLTRGINSTIATTHNIGDFVGGNTLTVTDVGHGAQTGDTKLPAPSTGNNCNNCGRTA